MNKYTAIDLFSGAGGLHIGCWNRSVYRLAPGRDQSSILQQFVIYHQTKERI